jgi:hypothetical protein
LHQIEIGGREWWKKDTERVVKRCERQIAKFFESEVDEVAERWATAVEKENTGNDQ